MQKLKPLLMAGSATLAIGLAVTLTNKLGANGSAFTGAAAGAIAGMGGASIVMVSFLEYYNRVNLLANTLSTLNDFENHLQELDFLMTHLEEKNTYDIESLQDRCQVFGRTLRDQTINLKNLAHQQTAYAQAFAALREELDGLKGEFIERTGDENQRFQALQAKIAMLRHTIAGDGKNWEDGYQLSKKLSSMRPMLNDVDLSG